MRRHATDVWKSEYECAPSPALPADHVLNSGSVLFPGSFDQNGCPLIIFPVDAQAKLSSELSKAEVADFINYFLCLHNKKQEEDSLVSVVADLRQASLPTTKFIAETVLLLERHKRTVHSVYVLQPKKKDAVKLLQKLLYHSASFKKVYMKEIPELCNYIDRSQLTVSLGGYLIYCHQSWVSFVKDINAFLQEFLSVVLKLPSCISTLQSLSKLPLPTTLRELQCFCSTNEDKFQQLRRELGLDDLLRHCESVVEKLHYPEKDPCYQAMAGTALFIHTTFDMLQNYSRITAAVEKVDLLWQQAFSQARLQLQVLQLREDALQITDKIKALFHERPYKLEIAKDAAKAAVLLSRFKESTHTPAMALVRCAEDVVRTIAEVLPVDSLSREHWVSDLEKLKEKLQSTVHFTLQTLRAVSNYHHYFNKANTWYSQVLSENLLQELLSGVDADNVATQHQRRTWGTVSVWRHKLSSFLKNHHPPDVEELVHLAHLSNVIPDDVVQQAGKQMSQRCLTLRKLLFSPGPVAVGTLQLALQWQYELLRSHHVCQSSDTATEGTAQDVRHGPSKSNLMKSDNEAAHCLGTFPSTAIIQVSAEGKPPSLSSFESSFNGARSSKQKVWRGREGMEDPNPLSRSTGTRDSVRPIASHVSSVSDPEFGCGSLGSASRHSIQIIPKVSEESLNVEIKVKRSAALPTNPWLSLSLDDLENMYTVTITQNHTPQKTDLQSHDPSYPCPDDNYFRRSHNLSSKVETLSSMQPRGPQSRDWILHSQSSLDDTILSPISHILSSTITDGRNKSTCTTEGSPTLIWDSYDLHEHDYVHR